MSKTTTDLETIRKHPGRFTWGRVVEFYDVGKYTIVKYLGGSQGSESFHVYVGGEDTRVGAGSIEEALVYAIAYGSGMERNLATHRAEAAAFLLVTEKT